MPINNNAYKKTLITSEEISKFNTKSSYSYLLKEQKLINGKTWKLTFEKNSTIWRLTKIIKAFCAIFFSLGSSLLSQNVRDLTRKALFGKVVSYEEEQEPYAYRQTVSKVREVTLPPKEEETYFNGSFDAIDRKTNDRVAISIKPSDDFNKINKQLSIGIYEGNTKLGFAAFSFEDLNRFSSNKPEVEIQLVINLLYTKEHTTDLRGVGASLIHYFVEINDLFGIQKCICVEASMNAHSFYYGLGFRGDDDIIDKGIEDAIEAAEASGKRPDTRHILLKRMYLEGEAYELLLKKVKENPIIDPNSLPDWIY